MICTSITQPRAGKKKNCNQFCIFCTIKTYILELQSRQKYAVLHTSIIALQKANICKCKPLKTFFFNLKKNSGFRINFRKAIKAWSEGKMQVGFLTLHRRTYFHNSRHDIGRKRQVLEKLDVKQRKWRQMNIWKAFKMFGIWMGTRGKVWASVWHSHSGNYWTLAFIISVSENREVMFIEGWIQFLKTVQTRKEKTTQPDGYVSEIEEKIWRKFSCSDRGNVKEN